MSEADFRTKRRQKFLTEKYFFLNQRLIQDLLDQNLKLDESGLTPDDAAYAGVFGSSFKNSLKLFRLHYTAGSSVQSLRPLYKQAMRWFAEWHRAEGVYSARLAKQVGQELRLDMTPIELGDLFHFQLALDVVSIGVLLGEANLVREAAAWMQSARCTDMVLEALLEKVVVDPCDVEEFFHENPYGSLLDAIYTADTPEQASAFVNAYLDGWYKAFDGVPWHNGHLVVTDEYSNYEGYWAFEAAAVCVLYDIDDSSFRDHLVYPKDLADWARSHDVVSKLAPASGSRALQLRCEGNQPCPQTGYWSTPALPNSRRHFKTGELMPVIETSTWGATVWYWDEIQGLLMP